MRGTDPQQAEAGRLVQLAAAPRPVGRSAAGGTCWFRPAPCGCAGTWLRRMGVKDHRC